MRRSLTLSVVLAAIAVLAVPALAASPIDVPREYRSKLAHVKNVSGIPVLLPSSLRAGIKPSRVFGTVEGLKRGRYELGLGVGRDCHGANACFVAAFFGERGAGLSFKRRVALAHGIVGRYHPISCGASCAPALVQWREGGVAYEIQFKGRKRQLVALANQAIRAGAR